jgi:AcrR family transcriptional regulator
MAVLRRHGPEALTMRQVAAEAGITATALYRHFEDKSALLTAVVAEVYRLFRKTMLASLPGTPPASWLLLAFDRYLRFALEHPNYYRLLFTEPHGIGIDRYPHDFQTKGAAAFRHLREVVWAGMQSGVVRGSSETEAGDVALTLYAHMHGLVMLHFAGRFGGNEVIFEQFFHDSMNRILRGLSS